MGVIVQTILALKDRYDYVLKAAQEVNTNALQSNLVDLIFKSFEALRPLRSEYKVVGDIVNSEGKVYEQIGVGEFIRTKSTHETYGSNFKPGSEWSRRRFVGLIREHGHLVTPHVRASIQEDFGRLMQITKDLKFYDELTVSLDIDPPITVHRHTYNTYSEPHMLEMDTKVVNRLFLKTDEPKTIIYNKIDPEKSWVSYPNYFDAQNEANLPVVEDLIDHLVKIYGMASEQVELTKGHNEPLVTEMDHIGKTYSIVKHMFLEENKCLKARRNLKHHSSTSLRS